MSKIVNKDGFFFISRVFLGIQIKICQHGGYFLFLVTCKGREPISVFNNIYPFKLKFCMFVAQLFFRQNLTNTCNHAFRTYLCFLGVASSLRLIWMYSTSLHTTYTCKCEFLGGSHTPRPSLIKLIYNDVRRSAEHLGVMLSMNTLIIIPVHVRTHRLWGSFPMLMNKQHA